VSQSPKARLEAPGNPATLLGYHMCTS